MAKSIHYYSQLSKQQNNWLGPYLGIASCGFAIFILCLLGYFIVSLFSGLIFLLIARKIQNSSKKQARFSFSKAGVYFSLKGHRLFIPWSSAYYLSREVYENRECFKITLKASRPGLDFSILAYDDKEPTPYEWKEEGFLIPVTNDFWPFFKKHASIFETYHSEVNPLHGKKEGGEGHEYSGKNTFFLDLQQNIQWPSFCPYSGEEVDSYSLLKNIEGTISLEVPVSKKGYTQYLKTYGLKEKVFLIVPVLCNFFLMLHYFTEPRSLAYGGGLTLLGAMVFFIAAIFAFNRYHPLKLDKIEGRARLTIYDKDTLSSFVQSNFGEEVLQPLLES